ncbi:RHS repeat-associated core domain-containing protein [Flammeovirga aprica JL-4]|uniref:RHS repeat-associated core domain-containing protein n=2 Tax=Flammeovirga aprica TaxID=29528 RepID=A0A7X9XDM2_9BACT|nr:RHS repeat-associated core domain-containing protein [Flammeovirga aprica JL-4]
MKIGIFNQSEEVNAYFDNLKVTFNDYIVQENHYYPFGMNMAGIEKEGTPDHKFQYNGKEKQEEIGLIDYGARHYDASLGRWFVVDPLAEKYSSMSPYNYVANNPLRYIDPDGKRIDIYSRGKLVGYYTYDKDTNALKFHEEVKGGKNTEEVKAFNAAYQYLKDADEEGVFNELAKTDESLNLNIKNGMVRAKYSSKLKEIKWSYYTKGKDAEGNMHSPALILYHELVHAKNNRLLKDDKYKKQKESGEIDGYSNLEEKNTIEQVNIVSKRLDNGDGGRGSRKSHGTNDQLMYTEEKYSDVTKSVLDFE